MTVFHNPDFMLADHGTIAILTPLSDEAKDWTDDHLPDDAMRHGQNGIVIEPRFVPPIIDGIEGDGMSIAM